MPDFAGSKTQRVNKYAGLRAPQIPRVRLAAWTTSQNYVLLFSQHLQARQSRQAFRNSRQTPLRSQPANAFPS